VLPEPVGAYDLVGREDVIEVLNRYDVRGRRFEGRQVLLVVLDQVEADVTKVVGSVSRLALACLG
jgi:hypothetical protein